ncbi:MAG: mechanosensitive ion channel family protein [Candidatus Bipolaricaulota bacterium]|nr:mechanosensitive ion channel family protein [Candidatus Bipolaricaulota bacterium]
MTFLQQVVAANPLWVWLLALGVGGATFGLLKLLKWLVLRHLGRRLERTPSEGIRLLADLVRRTQALFFLSLALLAASLALRLPPQAVRGIEILAIVAFLVQVASWGTRLITHWINREIRNQLEREGNAAAATTLNAVGVIVKIALWTVVLLLALDNLGVNITALITGLGIAGVAVALALQNILGDLFASMAIVVDKPFLVGDFIVVGNHMGTVERIGLKTTRLRSLSGEQLVYSNSELLRAVVQNYRRMTERRAVFTFRVPFSTPLEKLARVPELVRGAVEAQPLARLAWAVPREFGDHGIVYEVVYYYGSPDYSAWREVHGAIHLALLGKLRELGVELAYPTWVVHTSPPKEEAGGT